MKNTETKSCLGERYLGCSLPCGESLVLKGTPGNALGAYLNGGDIEVFGNAQDAVGDTMNLGSITVHGSAGDAAGYSMRGGSIYIEGDAGYRAGIHMKEYRDIVPALVVGGRCGSFLGEYQAGGVIVVLGLTDTSHPIVGSFCGAGMHGGRMYLRSQAVPSGLPAQVKSHTATDEDKALLKPYILEYCRRFSKDPAPLLSDNYIVLMPDSANPYKKLYVYN